MDAELLDRVSASLAAASLECAVRCIHTPAELGTTLWQLSHDEQYGRDVEAALARLVGVTGVLRKSQTCIRFDLDRTVPDAGRAPSAAAR
jgi:hypothetical protein